MIFTLKYDVLFLKVCHSPHTFVSPLGQYADCYGSYSPTKDLIWPTKILNSDKWAPSHEYRYVPPWPDGLIPLITPTKHFPVNNLNDIMPTRTLLRTTKLIHFRNKYQPQNSFLIYSTSILLLRILQCIVQGTVSGK